MYAWFPQNIKALSELGIALFQYDISLQFGVASFDSEAAHHIAILRGIS